MLIVKTELNYKIDGKRVMCNYIVSLSGGKDSTAMLHLMLEQGISIHSIVFFNTGWEFPDMLDHINLVEQKTGTKIVQLKPKKSFFHWMVQRKIIANKGSKKGQVHKIGFGWPTSKLRWCTGKKLDSFKKYANSVKNSTYTIGYAYDEKHRVTTNKFKYPLIEAKMTEADCLEYCKKLGYTWNGLYKNFARASCFCCPLQRIGELKNLRRNYPNLWERMLFWEYFIIGNKRFKGNKSVRDLENRFKKDDRMKNLFT